MSQSGRNLFLFLAFLTANTLLSYAPLSLESKLWVGLLGLILPAGIWLATREDGVPGEKPALQLEFLKPPPLWFWILFAALVLAARFFQLTTFSRWPLFDEATSGIDALHLSEKWRFRMFYGDSQAPPLFFWGLSLFFKSFGASLGTLWFFPALISCFAVPLAYGAARSYFSRSFSILCALLAGLSFWPLFISRYCLMTGLVLPAEYLALWLLGRFLKSAHPPLRKRAALWLGLGLGLGFYVHLHWPMVVALVALPFLLSAFSLPPKKGAGPGKLVVRTLVPLALCLTPLVIGAFRENFGHYFYHLWAFKGGFTLARQLPIWASYLTSPFWGMDPNVRTYQPVWGGFLNPVLSSLFFMGLLEVVLEWRRPLERWLVASLGICFLPSLLTQDQETFRLLPIFPILVIVTSMGFVRVLSAFSPRRRAAFLLLLFLPSMALDMEHLRVYHHIWDDPSQWGSYSKSVGRYRAYGILEDRARAEGPGLIFSDFVQGLTDQSLTVATYGFNAVANPRLALSDARWAAVLANVNYQPFLKRRFPDGKTYWLFKDGKVSDGGWMLFIFALTPERIPILEPWCRAQQSLGPFLELGSDYVSGQPFDALLEALQKAEPAFSTDPFLRACYWEKISDIFLKQDFHKIQEGMDRPEGDPALGALQRAVLEGYPAAHLYEHLGILWLMHHDEFEARKSFEKAVHAPLNLTDAAQYSDSLKAPAERKSAP